MHAIVLRLLLSLLLLSSGAGGTVALLRRRAHRLDQEMTTAFLRGDVVWGAQVGVQRTFGAAVLEFGAGLLSQDADGTVRWQPTQASRDHGVSPQAWPPGRARIEIGGRRRDVTGIVATEIDLVVDGHHHELSVFAVRGAPLPR